MEESQKKDIDLKKAKKYNKFSLIYDEFATELIINAIQESYSQAGVSNPEVEK